MYESFVINLDRNADRMRFMQAQFDALELPLTRLPAVNGYDLAISNPLALRFKLMMKGEIGCFESHRAFWRQVIERGLPGAYVLEDDVVVASDFGQLRYPDRLLAESDVIKIDTSGPERGSYGTMKIPVAPDRAVKRLMGDEISTGCYFVTARGARKLLALTKNYFLAVDTVMFTQQSRVFWDLTVWKLFPAAAVQLHFYMSSDDLGRDVTDGIQSKKRMGQDLHPTITPVKRARLALRRLMDWDFSRVRQQRRQRHIARFAQTEAVTEAVVPFHTPDHAHLTESLRHVVA
jgi:glycosyl transferase family 25